MRWLLPAMVAAAWALKRRRVISADAHSSRFSVADLTVTATGLTNEPGPDEWARLQKMLGTLDSLYRDVGPFRVTSGYRSPGVEQLVSGWGPDNPDPSKRLTHHMRGAAVDIVPTTMTMDDWWDGLRSKGGSHRLLRKAIHERDHIHLVIEPGDGLAYYLEESEGTYRKLS